MPASTMRTGRPFWSGAACSPTWPWGLALWLLPGRKSYLTALLLMAAMTVLATVLQPTLWLHPLGPLLKNLPIAAMLLHLMSAPVTPKESA